MDSDNEDRFQSDEEEDESDGYGDEKSDEDDADKVKK